MATLGLARLLAVAGPVTWRWSPPSEEPRGDGEDAVTSARVAAPQHRSRAADTALYVVLLTTAQLHDETRRTKIYLPKDCGHGTLRKDE